MWVPRYQKLMVPKDWEAYHKARVQVAKVNSVISKVCSGLYHRGKYTFPLPPSLPSPSVFIWDPLVTLIPMVLDKIAIHGMPQGLRYNAEHYFWYKWLENKIWGSTICLLVGVRTFVLWWYFSGPDDVCHKCKRINSVFILIMCPTFIVSSIVITKVKDNNFIFNSELQNDLREKTRDRWVVYTWKEIHVCGFKLEWRDLHVNKTGE